MKVYSVLKFAASALVLGTVMIGCTPKGMEHPATFSSVAPRVGASKASHAAGAAMIALSKRKPDKAVTAAETAVALSPRDAVYRALLGQAYLAAGRFSSAETSFHDAMTLAPDNVRTAMNLAIARIALGRWDRARADLAALKGKVGEADRGLALALAGDPSGAVDALETAARTPGANAKTRQNLALAYALDGQWAQARTTAAQDLQGAALDERMREWALLSQPKSAWDQIASLLHITPVEDPGQPTALALAAPAGNVLAEAVPVAPAPAPALPLPVVEAAPPMQITSVAPAAPGAAITPEASAAWPVSAEPTLPATPAVALQADPVPAAFLEQPVSEPLVYAGAAPAMDAAPPQQTSAARRTAPFLAAARHPARVPLTRAAPPPRIAQRPKGAFVVQLGAYSSAERVETAWNRQVARISTLSGYMPSSATFQHAGTTLYRLTLSGFETRGEAVKACETIRTGGGACFVRAAAGEQTVQWNSRRRGVALASR